eukprot:m.160400 g.160400  ORF g.160400 m.160400 type:complete len:163 (-) comp11942_c0_seq1:1149-1637(-)
MLRAVAKLAQRGRQATCASTRTAAAMSVRAASSSGAGPAAGNTVTTIEIQRPQVDRSKETVDQLRSRLVYQSRKRGIKELDLLMGTFAHSELHKFSEAELREYDVILNDHGNEWDMYKWLVGKEPVPDYLTESSVMSRLIVFTKNEGKEMRVELPPLRDQAK